MSLRAASVMFLMLSAPAAMAVISSSGNVNNTAPSGQTYFGNIGTLNGASAIYLGDGWVLTANHVAPSLPGPVNFGGTSYAPEPGTWQRLQNPAGSGLSTYTDIVLFRLATNLALPSIPISNAAPPVNAEVMLIGNGHTQGAEIFYNRTVNPGDSDDTWVQTLTAQGSTISGFPTTGTGEVRWGTNNISQTDLVLNEGSAADPLHVISLATTFSSSGLLEESQAVLGDSGGGVFAQSGGVWQLVGMTYSVGVLENQPGGSSSAFFGDETYIADLSKYRVQIIAAIPEPSASLLALASLGVITACRRRR